MSLVSVTTLLAFITQRMVSWRKHYRQYVGYNQYVILIYNLLLADLQQSTAFAISFHWLRLNKIVAPTRACFVQGWFLHIGDVSSGFFVLAIAIHTWLGVVKGYKMPFKWFVISILLIWSFALFLTMLGPAMHQDRYFARAAGWVRFVWAIDLGIVKLTGNSVGCHTNFKTNASGYIIFGSSLSSLAPSSSTHTCFSIYVAASRASWQTTPASYHEQQSLWSCIPPSTSS